MMAAFIRQVKSARQATVLAIPDWTFMTGIISGLCFTTCLCLLFLNSYSAPGYQLSDLAQLSGWQTTTIGLCSTPAKLVLLTLDAG